MVGLFMAYKEIPAFIISNTAVFVLVLVMYIVLACMIACMPIKM